MTLDYTFALVLGVFILVAYFILQVVAKIFEVRRNTQRQPPIEQEIRDMLKEQENRIMVRFREMLPNMTAVEDRFRRDMEAAEARCRAELSELRGRHEKAIPEIFAQIRQTNHTLSVTMRDITAMVSRIEGKLEEHLSHDGKGAG